MVACVNDEIILEVEDSQAEAVKTILEQVMMKAGEHYSMSSKLTTLEDESCFGLLTSNPPSIPKYYPAFRT